MKKLIVRFLILIFMLPFAVCLSSCEDNTPYSISSSQSMNESLGTYINDLKLNIKKNPTDYVGQQITLNGMIILKDGETFILDYHNHTGYTLEESATMTRAGILDKYAFKIVLAENIENSLLESMDYVELNGKITISNGEILLNDCECKILVASEEIPLLKN